MTTLAWAAEGARKDAAKYRVCIAITHEAHEGYGWCPLDAFLILHGPMANVGLATIVDLVGTQYANAPLARSMMDTYGEDAAACRRLDARYARADAEVREDWDDGSSMARSELAGLI